MTSKKRKTSKYYSAKQIRIRFAREFIMSVKDKCYYCGYNKSKAALEFHHVIPRRGQKTIRAFIKCVNAIELIKQELEKCIVVCSNCHREIHEYDVKET